MGLYIITTIISWIISIKFTADLTKKYKEEGYIKVERKKKLSDSISDWVRTILLLSTPIINILFTLLIQIAKKPIIESIICAWEIEGKLVRNDLNEIIDVTLKDVDEYQKEEVKEPIINKNNDLNRGYSTQTAEDVLERLKAERDFLIKEKENQTTFENDIGIQHELRMNRPWYFDED